MLATAAALAAFTFVSEDAACLAAGALIARGDLPAAIGIAACTFGIFLGDCALWALGRLGGRAVEGWSWVGPRLSPARVERSRQWLERHAGRAIVMSRFTPGARLPLYVTAGVVGVSLTRFAGWTLGASLIWTPAVVLAGARAGDAARPLGPSALWPFLAAASVLLLTHGARAVLLPHARKRLAEKLARLARWEFWPAWLFYAPVAVWVGVLAIRYGGLGTITASNPGIADGGVVGESKFDILQRLPREHTIPSARLQVGVAANRVERASECLSRHGWTFPVVLKPDVGQRGNGVRMIRSLDQLATYLSMASGDVLVQPFHEGPYEAGVFYYRFPGTERGRIFSITDKRFPVIVGDGRSTVGELIVAHPRYRLQASLFLRRHRHNAGAVLEPGERFVLAMAGNHAQGTTFHDGAHLLTPALERRIDEIARHYPGFFVGRFDIRYRDVGAFMAGHDLAIVELNGATAESTNIYDPATSLLDAYRILFRQWSLVFAIGAANRARGAAQTSVRRLARLVITHLTTAQPLALSD